MYLPCLLLHDILIPLGMRSLGSSPLLPPQSFRAHTKDVHIPRLFRHSVTMLRTRTPSPRSLLPPMRTVSTPSLVARQPLQDVLPGFKIAVQTL